MVCRRCARSPRQQSRQGQRTSKGIAPSVAVGKAKKTTPKKTCKEERTCKIPVKRPQSLVVCKINSFCYLQSSVLDLGHLAAVLFNRSNSFPRIPCLLTTQMGSQPIYTKSSVQEQLLFSFKLRTLLNFYLNCLKARFIASKVILCLVTY